MSVCERCGREKWARAGDRTERWSDARIEASCDAGSGSPAFDSECEHFAYERLSAAIAALKAHPAMVSNRMRDDEEVIDALRSAIAALPGGKP